MKKTSFPLSEVYRLLEPGPVVLITTIFEEAALDDSSSGRGPVHVAGQDSPSTFAKDIAQRRSPLS